VVRPVAKTFITGLAPRYDDKVVLPLTFIERGNTNFINNNQKCSLGLSKREFKHILDTLNDILFASWPCTLCQLIGYCLSPCTVGLSFLMPNIDVKHAREMAERFIGEVNEKVLHGKCI